MTEGPNDWKWQEGLATHEWNAAEHPVLTGLGTERPGGSPWQRFRRDRTTRGETRTGEPGFGGTTDGGGVRPGEPRKSVETRSTQQRRSWRGWHDHRRRQGLPA